jgi:hypothetical protein
MHPLHPHPLALSPRTLSNSSCLCPSILSFFCSLALSFSLYVGINFHHFSPPYTSIFPSLPTSVFLCSWRRTHEAKLDRARQAKSRRGKPRTMWTILVLGLLVGAAMTAGPGYEIVYGESANSYRVHSTDPAYIVALAQSNAVVASPRGSRVVQMTAKNGVRYSCTIPDPKAEERTIVARPGDEDREHSLQKAKKNLMRRMRKALAFGCFTKLVHTRTHMCIKTHTDAQAHANTHTHTHAHMHKINTCAHTHLYDEHTLTHIYTRTHTHTLTHT